MTNHPNRTIAAALKRILAGHSQYKTADAEGRENIRRNINTRLHELHSDGTTEQLVADYRRAFER